MGIRIHKTMGYGLANLKCKKTEIVDKRINPEGILRLDYEEAEKVYSRENFAKWLFELKNSLDEDHDDQLHLSWELVDAEHHPNGNQKAGHPQDCFIHQAEYGIPKVLNIIPYRWRFVSGEWYRYDSALDYYEEAAYFSKSSGAANRYKIMKDCIYPHLKYWDVRTGKIIEDRYAFHFRRMINSKQRGSELETCAKLMGFESTEECIKYMHPEVPRCVQLLCEFTKVFTNLDTIRELRPMIYVYWS